jgi:hypothetical protein
MVFGESCVFDLEIPFIWLKIRNLSRRLFVPEQIYFSLFIIKL